jgi:hypothetical protein
MTSFPPRSWKLVWPDALALLGEGPRIVDISTTDLVVMSLCRLEHSSCKCATDHVRCIPRLHLQSDILNVPFHRARSDGDLPSDLLGRASSGDKRENLLLTQREDSLPLNGREQTAQIVICLSYYQPRRRHSHGSPLPRIDAPRLVGQVIHRLDVLIMLSKVTFKPRIEACPRTSGSPTFRASGAPAMAPFET